MFRFRYPFNVRRSAPIGLQLVGVKRQYCLAYLILCSLLSPSALIHTEHESLLIRSRYIVGLPSLWYTNPLVCVIGLGLYVFVKVRLLCYVLVSLLCSDCSTSSRARYSLRSRSITLVFARPSRSACSVSQSAMSCGSVITTCLRFVNDMCITCFRVLCA